MYSPQVLDHFEHPRNAGELPEATASAHVENPVCGDVLELALKIENGVITAAQFRAKGCVASVACASRLTVMLVGRSVAEGQKTSRESLVESLGGLPEGSIHASHLAMDALAAALKKTTA